MFIRRLRGVLVATLLAGSLAGGIGLTSASAASATPSFSLSGTLVMANAHTHRISVQVGSTRQSIVYTALTHFIVRQRQMTVFALRARMRVTVQGLVRARWREALVVRIGPGPVPGTLPAPASPALQSALGAALQREQYALATYQNVIAQLGAIRPFANIIPAEQVHVATLKAFFSEYQLPLPTATVTGATAPATTSQACALGVTTEQSLVSLYDQQLPNVTSYLDVHQAFENFKTVSEENHLPAFERCA